MVADQLDPQQPEIVKRSGTSSLHAALEITTGKVIWSLHDLKLGAEPRRSMVRRGNEEIAHIKEFRQA